MLNLVNLKATFCQKERHEHCTIIYIKKLKEKVLFTPLTHETLQRQTNIPKNEDFVFHEKIG